MATKRMSPFSPSLPRRPPAFVSVIRCLAAALVHGRRGSDTCLVLSFGEGSKTTLQSGWRLVKNAKP
jgi:hypothetical protein